MRTISPRALALALCLTAACRSRPTREWTPRDHDPDGSTSAEQSPGSSGGDPLAAGRALFMAQCASCHGAEGRGDGPMAAMFRPADLSDPTLQSQRTDDELTRAIVNGKGRMPAFGAQLRPEAVPLLVRLIRSWRR
jgi:mono/diheme cytochrome c family protein